MELILLSVSNVNVLISSVSSWSIRLSTIGRLESEPLELNSTRVAIASPKLALWNYQWVINIVQWQCSSKPHRIKHFYTHKTVLTANELVADADRIRNVLSGTGFGRRSVFSVAELSLCCFSSSHILLAGLMVRGLGFSAFRLSSNPSTFILHKPLQQQKSKHT